MAQANRLPFAIALTGAACVLVAGALGAVFAQQQKDNPPAGDELDLRTVLLDVDVLLPLRRMEATKEQVQQLAEIVAEWKQERERAEQDLRATLEANKELLLQLRKNLVSGEPLDQALVDQYLAVQRNKLLALRDNERLIRSYAERVANIFSEEQLARLLPTRLPPAARQPGAREGRTFNLLAQLRQLTDEAFERNREMILRRLLGPRPPEDVADKLWQELARIRKLTEDEFEAQRDQILKNLRQIIGSKRLLRLAPRASEKRAPEGEPRAAKPSRERDAGQCPAKHACHASKHGPCPCEHAGQAAALRAEQSEAQHAGREAALGFGLFGRFLAIPDERWEQVRDNLIRGLLGGQYTEQRAQQLRELLEQVRKMDREELRGRLPELARRLAEITGREGVAARGGALAKRLITPGGRARLMLSLYVRRILTADDIDRVIATLNELAAALEQ